MGLKLRFSRDAMSSIGLIYAEDVISGNTAHPYVLCEGFGHLDEQSQILCYSQVLRMIKEIENI